MTAIGSLWNGRTVAPFVKVEDLPEEFKPIGKELNTGERTIEDLLREIKALNTTIENMEGTSVHKDKEVD